MELPTLEWLRGMADANGMQLAWEACGHETGEPVVLVMGLGCQLIHWPERFCQLLVAQGFRVIRFDNRDIGLSSEASNHYRFDMRKDWLKAKLGMSIKANYTLYDMAADTVGVFDALGLDRAHLVGVSMGGMISQLVSGLYPERVSSLTSIMSTTNERHLPGPTLPVLVQMSKGKVNHDREASIARNVKLFEMIGSPDYPTSQEQRREIAGMAYDRAYRPNGLARQTHGIIATGGFAHIARQIQAPTQIIHGTHDPLVRPACGKHCASIVPNARLALLEGMGHDFPQQLMSRWVELITQNASRVS